MIDAPPCRRGASLIRQDYSLRYARRAGTLSQKVAAKRREQDKTIDKLLPHMVKVGLNAVEALEPAAGVDLAHLKDTLGDQLCFIGGIDASDILNFGSPKDVEEEVKRCISSAAKEGGYFAGPSHNILNAPWENILALRAEIEKYRKYPLKIP